MDNRIQVDAVYTDFSKAFDTIEHKLLLEKLGRIGIHGSLIDWFKSYLSDRTQSVVVNGFMSESIFVTSGVPQGSHLGPLLFLIFINDINVCFNFCKFILFADDMKIYHAIQSVDDSRNFQEDLNRLICYISTNKLKLNISKCYQIAFTRNRSKIEFNYRLNDQNIEIVSSVKDLGITLDSKLIFDIHVDKIVKKGFKMLGFIRQNSSNFKRPKTLLSLYSSLVRSQVEFGSVCWNPQYNIHINRLERIQVKFIKHFKFKFPNYNTSSLQSLENRRKVADLSFLHKLFNGVIDSNYILSQISINVPSHSTRQHHLFYNSTVNTNASFNSALNRITYLHNNFSTPDLFMLPIKTFKYKMFDILKDTVSF